MDNVHFPRIDDNTTLRSAQTPVTEHQYVIILGKSHGGMRNAYAMIDPDSKTIIPKLNLIVWSRLVDTIEYATCVFKNCLYVIGGVNKTTGEVLRHVQKYDPYIGRWKQCADLCRPRTRHACAAIYGKIYVFGGMTSSTKVSDACESYEPLIDEWHEESFKLPQPRRDHACVVRDDNVYILGGASPTQVANNNIWVLCRFVPDPRDQENCTYEWSTIQDPVQTDMGYSLSRHAVAVTHDRMFILGGLINGRTADGRTVIRHLSVENASQLVNGHANSPLSAAPPEVTSNAKDKKMLITTSAIMESYKFRGSIPDFGIDDDVAEAEVRQMEEIAKQRQKISRKRNRKRRGKTDPIKAKRAAEEMEKMRKEQEEEKAKEEELRKIRMKTSWKSNLPNLPEPRCDMGTVVIGNKIYVIGGHMIERGMESHMGTVHYYHTRRHEWYEAFDLPDDGNYSSVDCCVLTIPRYNKDFRPMKYSGCKWVLW